MCSSPLRYVAGIPSDVPIEIIVVKSAVAYLLLDIIVGGYSNIYDANHRQAGETQQEYVDDERAYVHVEQEAVEDDQEHEENHEHVVVAQCLLVVITRQSDVEQQRHGDHPLGPLRHSRHHPMIASVITQT